MPILDQVTVEEEIGAEDALIGSVTAFARSLDVHWSRANTRKNCLFIRKRQQVYSGTGHAYHRLIMVERGLV